MLDFVLEFVAALGVTVAAVLIGVGLWGLLFPAVGLSLLGVFAALALAASSILVILVVFMIWGVFLW